MVKYPPAETVVGYSGMALGAVSFVGTQIVAREALDSFMKACTVLTTEEYLDSGFCKYEALLGGPFACLVTNFLFEVTRTPEGSFVWWLLSGLALPATVVLCVEGNRKAAKGLIRYPTVVSLFSQCFGISVTFPSLWIPGFMWGGHYDGQVGVGMVYLSLAISLLAGILSFLLTTLNTSSLAWTVSAGALGGPVVGLLPLGLTLLSSPFKDQSYPAKARGAHALANAYDVTGLLSFAGYIFSVYRITQVYGIDSGLIWGKMWASGVVAAVSLNAVVLHLALTLTIFYRGFDEAVTALVFVPLMGPGAAVSQALARQERKLARFFDQKAADAKRQ